MLIHLKERGIYIIKGLSLLLSEADKRYKYIGKSLMITKLVEIGEILAIIR